MEAGEPGTYWSSPGEDGGGMDWLCCIPLSRGRGRGQGRRRRHGRDGLCQACRTWMRTRGGRLWAVARRDPEVPPGEGAPAKGRDLSEPTREPQAPSLDDFVQRRVVRGGPASSKSQLTRAWRPAGKRLYPGTQLPREKQGAAGGRCGVRAEPCVQAVPPALQGALVPPGSGGSHWCVAGVWGLSRQGLP